MRLLIALEILKIQGGLEFEWLQPQCTSRNFKKSISYAEVSATNVMNILKIEHEIPQLEMTKWGHPPYLEYLQCRLPTDYF